MIASNNYIGAQILTFAIPVGTFCVVTLLGFFARKRQL
jgi:hypothetical protein